MVTADHARQWSWCQCGFTRLRADGRTCSECGLPVLTDDDIEAGREETGPQPTTRVAPSAADDAGRP